MEKQKLKNIIQSALLAYGQPLSLDKLHSLFVTEVQDTEEGEQQAVAAEVEKKAIEEVLQELQQDCEGSGCELKKVATGWRFQVRVEMAPWVNKLWEEKPQRYSRALMETIAIIAYRQPITRGDIEEIRGVAVSSNIIKTLSEREWVKVIGHRDVPGRPALYATTRQFLDYFNLQSLDELPTLQELTDIETLNPELNLGIAEVQQATQELSVSDAPIETDTNDDVTADTAIGSNDGQVVH